MTSTSGTGHVLALLPFAAAVARAGDEVLLDPSYRTAAERLAASIHALPPVDDAVPILHDLCA